MVNSILGIHQVGQSVKVFAVDLRLWSLPRQTSSALLLLHQKPHCSVGELNGKGFSSADLLLCHSLHTGVYFCTFVLYLVLSTSVHFLYCILHFAAFWLVFVFCLGFYSALHFASPAQGGRTSSLLHLHLHLHSQFSQQPTVFHPTFSSYFPFTDHTLTPGIHLSVSFLCALFFYRDSNG